jgi:peroxiredoxin (alkyl hydroperoxide reductase subunit C)
MINQPAPLFTTQAVYDGGEVKELSLADYKGKWVVLFFYPLDFTLVCPTELTQFREYIGDFKSAGAAVFGCSVDSVHAHKRWLRDDLGNLGYPLISDLTKRIAKDYGVLIEDRGIATRATFIIDPDQKLQFIGIHNTAVGRDASEILRVLEACQSGELCQAGWKRGDSHLLPLK